jgi:hypothetical protein
MTTGLGCHKIVTEGLFCPMIEICLYLKHELGRASI